VFPNDVNVSNIVAAANATQVGIDKNIRLL
jgi:hypothetical protein